MTQTLSASKATAVAIIATVLALSLALVLATQPAGAEEPATEVATTGEVTSGSGGTSLVVNLGDLKKFPCTTTIGVPCHAGYEVVATDYDDDPGGEPGAPDFYVTPNLGDSPSLRHAWKIVFIDFGGTNDVTAIQKAIRWTAAEVPTAPGPDQNPAGQIVYETVVDVVANPGELLVGQACADFLGDPLTPNTPAHGLVTTDQMAASVLVDLTNRCIQQEVGVHPNNFTVSKHLPPGTYTESITLVYGSNGQAVPFTKDFFVNAVTGYTVDFDLVDWGDGLAQGLKGVASGDWDLTTPGAPTIQGLGNTSPVLSVRYTPLLNIQPDQSRKLITDDFDIQINRKNTTGTLVEFQHLEPISGGTVEGAFGPLATLSGPTSTIGGRPSSGAVCLEPNEQSKLDFSVTPFDPVFTGTYDGLVELSIAVDLVICTPSLDPGESSTGDLDVFDNNPSQP